MGRSVSKSRGKAFSLGFVHQGIMIGDDFIFQWKF